LSFVTFGALALLAVEFGGPDISRLIVNGPKRLGRLDYVADEPNKTK